MPDEPMPKCPCCGSSKQVYPDGHRNFFCRTCKRVFDNEPDEGGEYSDFDPSWRMEREERKGRKRRNREGRRRG